MRNYWRIIAWYIFIIAVIIPLNPAFANKYELTRNSVEDPGNIYAEEISLYRVKLGDPEAKAVEMLVEERISGVRAEQEGTFILLWDKRKPTGAMAGVRIMDGKVDLIFVNNRFAHKVRGIFRRVLNSKTAQEIRELLGKEDFPNETFNGSETSLRGKGIYREFPRSQCQH